MFCQPSILPPSMAACCDGTLCLTLGTLSGSVAGVTTAPSDSVTEDGIPPAGQRPGLASHQKPRMLSNEWFSASMMTTCLMGDAVPAACGWPTRAGGGLAAGAEVPAGPPGAAWPSRAAGAAATAPVTNAAASGATRPPRRHQDALGQTFTNCYPYSRSPLLADLSPTLVLSDVHGTPCNSWCRRLDS